MSKVAILGAGIAGLAAARTLRDNNVEYVIYEAHDRAGGLLSRREIDGFTFDSAVHLSFASESEVREVFDRTPYHTHTPRSLCHDNGVWMKHPVQNNLFPLSSEEKVGLIAGLVEQEGGTIGNYRDWLVQQYGLPIAERWPLVYTEKYWSLSADHLGTAWVGSRMRKADIREVLAGAFNANTPNHYYVSEMRYPEQGGYQSFIDPLISTADIKLNHRIAAIDLEAKQLTFDNGMSHPFDKLISTLPLPDLVKIIKIVPSEVKRNAETLFATSMDLISIGFSKPDVSPALWFYIYDKDIMAARAYSPDRKSPKNVPTGCSALQFEIYSSKHSAKVASPLEMKENTINALKKMGLASQDEILFVQHDHVAYANVVFDVGMEGRRDLVRHWLERHNICLAGRFGRWEYLWSNQAFVSGVRAAERVCSLGV